MEILPLSELEQMDEQEKIQTLRRYREVYTIKDLSQAWGLSNPIQYYMWLKKQRIYDHLVRRTEKSDTARDWARLKDLDARDPDRRMRGLSADQFRYSLDKDSVGPELAHVFRRLSDFLLNEQGTFRCRIELRAIASQMAEEKEWKDEEAGA